MPYDLKSKFDEEEDPELLAEAELAKTDPSFAKKPQTPAKIVQSAASGDAVVKPEDKTFKAKKPKSVNQAKGLRKQRQRGVSGCSSRKYSGIDMDMDFDLEHDEEEENDEYDDYDASEKYEYDEQDETFVDSIVALKLSPRKRADTSDSAISSVNLSESQK